MAGLNRVMLLGNLGADPELKVTPGGQAILKIRLATTETYLDKNNARQERTEWHRVTVWGKRGEALAKILTKGSNIFVEGSIRTSSYEVNGEKRYSTDIVAKDILFTGRRGGGGARDDVGGGSDFAPRQARSSSTPRAAAPAPEMPFDDFAGGGGGGEDAIPF